MSVRQEVHDRLASLEERLRDRPGEASEVRAIRQLLDQDEAGWIGTDEARRILGAHSVRVVEAWAAEGWLRSRERPDGRLLVSREDVLHRREEHDALGAMGSYDGPWAEEIDALAQGPASPEVEALIAPILALAEARLREVTEGRKE